MTDLCCDAVIFGGGVAGLWALAELTERGRSALLFEAHALGAGQTIQAQGILHSGLKYTLQGLLTPAARAARTMPAVWRACLSGAATPDLRRVRRRSEFCYLWHTGTVSSRCAMFGAQAGLSVTPRLLAPHELPAILTGFEGQAARLDEQVIAPASLLEVFREQFAERIRCVDADSVRIDPGSTGRPAEVVVRPPAMGVRFPAELRLRTHAVVLAAGAGNARLRAQCGLGDARMQRRPLQMVHVQGPLPEFCGHCVDGMSTRVTITSDRAADGTPVWQLGGQLAETGESLSPAELVARARRELAEVLPQLDQRGLQWGTSRIDRAEGATWSGRRPDGFTCRRDGKIVTAWPTKLVLAPQLARAIADAVENLLAAGGAAGTPTSEAADVELQAAISDWPLPHVAASPWDAPQRMRAAA